MSSRSEPLPTGSGGAGGDPPSTGASGGTDALGGSSTQGGSGGTSSGGSGGGGQGSSGGAATNSGGRAGSNGGGAATAGTAGTTMIGDAGALGAAGAPPASGYALFGAPLLFAPTATGFGLSVVLSVGDPSTLGLRVREDGTDAWNDALPPEVRASDLAEWHVDGLTGNTGYEYEVVGTGADGEVNVHHGRVTTTRPSGSSFSFALITDTHIGSDLSYTNQGNPQILGTTSTAIRALAPDFVVNLGDMLDFHEYGFNDPPPDGSITRAAYLNYRASFGRTLGNVPHYAVIGGWDSESGCNTPDEIDRSRTQRLLYLPGPTPDTYPEGGSPFEDYYAFTWGDALFVMLNVYTYTPTCHLLDTYPGLPDDWTLGDAQMAWLRTTLENATSKWRFLLIHHPVGGNGGDDADSAYGRGGGRAAYVGEQQIVHELMQEYGVQTFFYGHDHVFTDMLVDDIHYSLPGSAGAIWFFDSSETGYTDYWADSGWARVDVTPDDVHVQFLATTGDLLYDYTLQ
ncbi:MAG TPA: metallophosphoesterase [Polyangiaceae bacterium]|nr:metallophosphoesterase [Polyangiaceae bacterium]